MVKCLSAVNRNCILKGVQVPLQVKIQRIRIWRGAWRPWSESFSTCPLGMTGVTENMWPNMRAFQTVTNNPCPHTDAELLLAFFQL
jgi:hypothetical protein